MVKSVLLKSGQGLFSILALVVALGTANDALACTFLGGKLHYCSTTRTYGTWSGSFITSAQQFGDNLADLHQEEPGFFDAHWFTPNGQSFECTYKDDNGKDHPALCTAAVECKKFTIGACKGGKRINQMLCPTAGGSPGCSGQIAVTLTGGAVFPDPDNPNSPATKTFPIPVEDVPATDCNKQFPRINKVLDQKIIGEIVTGGCTTDTATFSDQDPVFSSVVRGPLNDENPSATYMETSDGPWVPYVSCEPEPATGFPTKPCQHDGGFWATILNNPDNPDPIVDPALCVAMAKELTCGDQFVDGKVVPGPAPTQAMIDSAGNCRVRCSRCDRDGTLVNLSGGSVGTFVVADPKGVTSTLVSGKRPWAAPCPVTVTGQ